MKQKKTISAEELHKTGNGYLAVPVLDKPRRRSDPSIHPLIYMSETKGKNEEKPIKKHQQMNQNLVTSSLDTSRNRPDLAINPPTYMTYKRKQNEKKAVNHGVPSEFLTKSGRRVDQVHEVVGRQETIGKVKRRASVSIPMIPDASSLPELDGFNKNNSSPNARRSSITCDHLANLFAERSKAIQDLKVNNLHRDVPNSKAPLARHLERRRTSMGSMEPHDLALSCISPLREMAHGRRASADEQVSISKVNPAPGGHYNENKTFQEHRPSSIVPLPHVVDPVNGGGIVSDQGDQLNIYPTSLCSEQLLQSRRDSAATSIGTPGCMLSSGRRHSKGQSVEFLNIDTSGHAGGLPPEWKKYVPCHEKNVKWTQVQRNDRVPTPWPEGKFKRGRCEGSFMSSLLGPGPSKKGIPLNTLKRANSKTAREKLKKYLITMQAEWSMSQKLEAMALREKSIHVRTPTMEDIHTEDI